MDKPTLCKHGVIAVFCQDSRCSNVMTTNNQAVCNGCFVDPEGVFVAEPSCPVPGHGTPEPVTSSTGEMCGNVDSTDPQGGICTLPEGHWGFCSWSSHHA